MFRARWPWSEEGVNLHMAPLEPELTAAPGTANRGPGLKLNASKKQLRRSRHTGDMGVGCNRQSGTAHTKLSLHSQSMRPGQRYMSLASTTWDMKSCWSRWSVLVRLVILPSLHLSVMPLSTLLPAGSTTLASTERRVAARGQLESQPQAQSARTDKGQRLGSGPDPGLTSHDHLRVHRVEVAMRIALGDLHGMRSGRHLVVAVSHRAVR